MKRFLTSLLLLAVCQVNAAEKLYSERPTVTPELAKPGEYQVGVTTQTWTNPGQLSTTDFKSKLDRTLTLEIWYPATIANEQGPTTYKGVTRLHREFELQASAFRDAPPLVEGEFPLVVLSHGYTGYRTIMFYLGEHLASLGYVVVGIDHTDSTNGDIDFKNAGGAGFPSTLINRARDQQFVLDYLSKASGKIAAITDTDKAAVIGYSMGGYGAINTVGGCYQFSAQGLQRLGYPEDMAKALEPVFNFCNAGREEVDPRWHAMVAFAPWGQELMVHKPESLASLKVPTLYVAGEYDDVVGYENGVKRLFEQTSAESTYMLVYRDARHNMAPHPAPKVAYADDIDMGHYYEPSWSSETLNRNNQHLVTAFLGCHVKAEKDKCDYLPTRENSNQVKGQDGKLSAPWPGFPDRWGTGMSFFRK